MSAVPLQRTGGDKKGVMLPLERPEIRRSLRWLGAVDVIDRGKGDVAARHMDKYDSGFEHVDMYRYLVGVISCCSY